MPEFNSKIEEADHRLIPHIHYSISHGAKESVVVSNDTDVFALLIHYLPDFLGLGLQELWIMFDVGDKTRFLPLQLLLYKIGVPKCKVIYKAHFDWFRFDKQDQFQEICNQCKSRVVSSAIW